VFCLLGFPNVLIKEIAVGEGAGDWSRAGNVTYTANWICSGATCIVGGALICLIPWMTRDVFCEMRLMRPLVIAIGILPVQVLASICLYGLIGRQKVWQAELLNQILSLVSVALIIAFMVGSDCSVTITRVAVAYAASRVVSYIGISVYSRRLQTWIVEDRRLCWPLFSIAIPLLLVESSGVLASNVDAIMLGWLGNASQVGLYSVAARLSLLTSLFLQVTNTVLAPKIAVMYSEKRLEALEVMIQRVTAAMTLIGFLALLAFVLFGRLLLSAWGVGFIQAYGILIVLSVGQFVNLATGANGLIMMMSGHERALSRIRLSQLLINVMLNAILIKYFYALGAAIATGTSMILSNAAKLYYVRRVLGIRILPLC
jgi:O-antigen/teichoic acid export membrane protein